MPRSSCLGNVSTNGLCEYIESSALDFIFLVMGWVCFLNRIGSTNMFPIGAVLSAVMLMSKTGGQTKYVRVSLRLSKVVVEHW